MNTKQLMEKTKEVVKKVNTKTWIAGAAVLIIGIAVLLNVLFMPAPAMMPVRMWEKSVFR